MMELLKFNKANEQAKLQAIEKWIGYKPKVYSFSLPSGYTCPFAVDCLSKANKQTGKITDGKDALYRCFSATAEAYQPGTRDQRWWNFDILRKLDYNGMVETISASIPADADVIRVHVGGDFFSQRYFEAWLEVAKLNPNITFYAYTKSLPYWVANMDIIPDNFALTASRGGRYDDLIDNANLKTATVVLSPQEAHAKGLPIDHDEYHAINNAGDFALLIHGTQPKGSAAAEATRSMKAQGVEYAYSRS